MDTQNNAKDLVQKWKCLLAQAGYRITQPRRVILEIIAASARPLTPREIYDLARSRQVNISLVTVYRTVEKLEELELVNHVHHFGQCQTVFRGAREHHQHLIVCTRCGRSVYFDGFDTQAEYDRVAEALGYLVSDHWLQLAGLCEECQHRIKEH